MKKQNGLSLISSIIFLIFGIILFAKPDGVVKLMSNVFGAVLILMGAYRTINYIIQNKRLQVVNYNELAFGVTAIVLGIVLIFLSESIAFLLRLIIGIWVIVAGLNKIMQTFYTTDRSNKFYALIVMGIVLVGIGLYIVLEANLALSIIGLFMVLYAIIDIVSYFMYNKSINDFEKDLKDAQEYIENEIIEGEAVIKEAASESKKKKAKKK